MSSSAGSDSASGGGREAYGGGGQYGGGTTSDSSGDGRQDVESQYGGDYGYDSSQNVSDRDQQYGGGSTNDRPTIADVTGDTLPGSYGAVDPDPEIDTPTSERQDTITSFSKNLEANIKSNPFSVLTPTSTLAKTALQTLAANAMLGNLGFAGTTTGDTDGTIGGDGNGGLTREQINQLTPYAPFLMSGTVAPESQVSQYFANLPTTALSSNLQTSYNNAKTNVNSLLGITPTSQQFGYSTQPYGLLSATNLAANPFNINYLQQRGLI